jgi:hypothetical protein
MKWLFVLLNIGAAFGVIQGGAAIRAIHRVHSYSTYVSLVDRGAIVAKPEKIAELKSGVIFEDSQDSVQRSLEDIGGLDGILPKLTYTAAALFLLNAVVLSVVWRKQLVQPLPPS